MDIMQLQIAMGTLASHVDEVGRASRDSSQEQKCRRDQESWCLHDDQREDSRAGKLLYINDQ